MACFRTCHKTYSLHQSAINGGLHKFSIRQNTSETPIKKKRFQHRRFRYPKSMALFEKKMDDPPDGKWTWNEHGEPESKYGDWLHMAHTTLGVRDYKVWEEDFRKLRKKYKQEYNEKFRQRLAEFTRITDAKMYDLNLQQSQERERKRLSNIRINALKSANRATKARKRLEYRRKNDIIRFDARDSKRDLIREMIWEKPGQNWIIKENFNDKLNMGLMNELLDSNIDNMDNIDSDYIESKYVGLPQNGYYDTMEGLWRHSDAYFQNTNNDISEAISAEQNYTSITKQPISWYKRGNDSTDEFVKEIYDSQLALNKHMKRINNNNRRKAQRKGENINKSSKEDNIEYEIDGQNIVPNYWFNIDWNNEFEKRSLHKNSLDKSPIFIGNNLILEYEIDKYEDLRLLIGNKKYYNLLKECANMSKTEIMRELKEIFAELIPEEILNKYEDVQSKDEFLEVIINDIITDTSNKRMKDSDHKRWSLYTEFNKKMKHFGSIQWKSAKINFDSEIRKWRGDFLKWRYLVFEDNKEHIEWRHRLRRKELSTYDINMCKTAIVRFQQLEHLILARRTGPHMLENLINSLEPQVLKVFYIWFEELTEAGEEICMGKGWSFNRYEEKHMLPPVKAKQLPIEYFKLHIAQSKTQ